MKDMALSEATELYQVALEQARANPLEDQLAAMADHAYGVMERLWLEAAWERVEWFDS